jgi:hypothetical protein
MTNLNQSINNLINVIKDDNCKKMNLSNTKGYLGELLVYQKLQEEGNNLLQKGNQSGYDLEILGTRIKIDVKLSTLKTEVKNCPPYWGWALKHTNKKRELSASHFVCVALDEHYKVKCYYVIKASDVKYFPASAIGQFSGITHGLIIPQNIALIEQLADNRLKKYFKKCSGLLKTKVKTVRKNSSLSKSITGLNH